MFTHFETFTKNSHKRLKKSIYLSIIDADKAIVDTFTKKDLKC